MVFHPISFIRCDQPVLWPRYMHLVYNDSKSPFHILLFSLSSPPGIHSIRSPSFFSVLLLLLYLPAEAHRSSFSSFHRLLYPYLVFLSVGIPHFGRLDPAQTSISNRFIQWLGHFLQSFNISHLCIRKYCNLALHFHTGDYGIVATIFDCITIPFSFFILSLLLLGYSIFSFFPFFRSSLVGKCQLFRVSISYPDRDRISHCYFDRDFADLPKGSCGFWSYLAGK